jgi:hypothetical protein
MKMFEVNFTIPRMGSARISVRAYTAADAEARFLDDARRFGHSDWRFVSAVETEDNCGCAECCARRRKPQGKVA